MSSKKPFFFLYTGDEFSRRAKIESFLKELLPQALRLTNLFRYYPDDINWKDVLRQAATPSLMGDKQVIWISQAEKIKKSDSAVFDAYCANPAQNVFFIFEAEDLSETHPLRKLSERFGKHIHLGSQDREQGYQFLRAKLKQAGKTMTPEAWQTLEERLGGSQRLMDLVCDQIILYAEAPVIDGKTVETLSAEYLKYEPFDLTEALAQKDTASALRIFRYLYELAGDSTSVVGLIHWQLRRIWQAKRILSRGGQPDEVGRAVRVPPFRLSSFLGQARQFKSEDIEPMIDRLWQLDWDLKRGLGDDRIAVELFLAAV